MQEAYETKSSEIHAWEEEKSRDIVDYFLEVRQKTMQNYTLYTKYEQVFPFRNAITELDLVFGFLKSFMSLTCGLLQSTLP